MTDPLDIDTMRSAAQAPATSPLVARLQAMIRALLPLHEAAAAPASDDSAAEPSRETCVAFINAVEKRMRYSGNHDWTDLQNVAAGIKAVRAMGGGAKG